MQAQEHVAQPQSGARRRRRGMRAGRFGLVLLILLGLLACHRTSDEQALRDAVAALQRAVEQRQADDFMDYVSADFAGDNGMDAATLRRLLVVQFLRNQAVGVTIGPLTLRIEEARAEIAFRVFLTGSSGGLIPERAEGYQITTLWRKEGGDWQVEHARWE